MNNKTATDVEVFQQKLTGYKQLIDDDIAEYSKQVQATTLEQYGKNAQLEVGAYLAILGRGGKRIRGSLVMLGYEMSGGRDRKMIVQAARAIEMLHAYILIIDDIQDRSDVRRGGPTANIMLADYHRKNHLAGQSEHFGVSIALNAALSSAHAAQTILANLDGAEELRLRVLSIVNNTMIVTAHGQTGDIMNEVSPDVGLDDIERVIEWKTAHYTFLNPLHVGMVLAGADSRATDAITPYAMHVGPAFQIVDDILGTFGGESETGKSPMDDTREGKRTLLSVYALDHAEPEDKNFLLQMLGNQNLTEAEFKRCQEIILATGALDYSRGQADKHIKEAIKALENTKQHWSQDGAQFLRGLAEYLLERQA